MKRSRWDTPSPPVPSAKHQPPPPWNNVPQLPQQHQLQQQHHLPQQHHGQLPQQQQMGVKRGHFQQQQFGKGRGKKKKNKKGNAAK